MKSSAKPPRLIIFDWDGTLCDSISLIVDCFQVAAEALNLAVPEPKNIRYTIGMDLAGAMKHMFGPLSSEQTTEFVARYRAYYLTRVEQLELFPGARDLLESLDDSGILAAVATGKNRVGLERALSITDSAHFFKASRCSDESTPKPAPDMVLELLTEMEILPEDALVIGDTTHDLHMAAGAGTQALAATYGAHAPELLKEAPHAALLNDIRELPRFL